MTFEEFLVRLLYPALVFVLPSERWAAIYFMTGLLAAFYVFWRFAERGPDGNRDVAKKRGFLRFLFPAEIWTHPSARADYSFFIVNKLLLIFVVGYFALSAETFAAWLGAVFEGQFGPAGTAAPHWGWAVVTTLAVAAALDFGLWFAHYLLHRIPFLWELHKVHHSAEVMTPFTAARVHPLEDLFAATLGALTAGTAYALSGHLLGPAAHELTLFQTNVVLIGFFFAAFVLRHSHVWLAYPVWLQHILISPAQHHIHHSAERRHWDKNMGFVFAIWDWAAGTLYAPKTYERITFGLGNGDGEEVKFRRLRNLYLLPLENMTAMVKRTVMPRRATSDAGVKSETEGLGGTAANS
ncbi:MAG: sterol desaturase family protein [Pseudomonadota bacterium]